MSLMHASSPHSHAATSTGQIMRWVLIATLPGIAAQAWFFGWGIVLNVLCAAGLGVLLEALILRLR